MSKTAAQMTVIFIFIKVLGVDIPNRGLYWGSMSTEEREIKLNFTMKETDFFIIVRSLFVCVHETRWIPGLSKLEMWVTSLSDTPQLQYYDVQTLEHRYISCLLNFYETLHSCSTQPADVHEEIWSLSKIWKGR
jgi:hypothetical protein